MSRRINENADQISIDLTRTLSKMALNQVTYLFQR
jgi:hypothetical protein